MVWGLLLTAGPEGPTLISCTASHLLQCVRGTQSPAWRGLGVPQSAVKDCLKLDKSSVSRRIKDAIALGYLVDKQEKKGRPAKLEIGEPMPDEVEVLPRPDVLAGNGCTVAAFSEGEGAPDQSPTDASAGSTEDGAFLEAAE